MARLTVVPTRQFPCGCVDHASRPAFLELRGHRYSLSTAVSTVPVLDRLTKWRWLCSCGARGTWQYQSDWVAYHAWIKHVRRAARKQADANRVTRLTQNDAQP